VPDRAARGAAGGDLIEAGLNEAAELWTALWG